MGNVEPIKKAQYLASIPEHLKAMSNEELSTLFWSDDQTYIDEIHMLLNLRGRGDLCAV